MVDERTDFHPTSLRRLLEPPLLVGVPSDLIVSRSVSPTRIHDINQIHRWTAQLSECMADSFLTETGFLSQRSNGDADSIPPSGKCLTHELEEHALGGDRKRRESTVQVAMENGDILKRGVTGGAQLLEGQGLTLDVDW